MNDSPSPRILDDVAEEGQRLASEAYARDLGLRLLGGVAVWHHCPSARIPPLKRPYGDADFVGRSSERKPLSPRYFVASKTTSAVESGHSIKRPTDPLFTLLSR